MSRRWLFAMLAILAVSVPSQAAANARLISVAPLDGGCEDGPTGHHLAFWDIQPGKKYEFIIDDVEECGDCGTDPTLKVLVRSSTNVILWEGLAELICPGKYRFCFTLPLGSSCAFGIRYCTKPGIATSGLSVHRFDGDDRYKVFLRAASFNPDCSCPSPIQGPECSTSATHASTWASLKRLYR